MNVEKNNTREKREREREERRQTLGDQQTKGEDEDCDRRSEGHWKRRKEFSGAADSPLR